MAARRREQLDADPADLLVSLSPKKLPVAPSLAPIATHNKHAALAENIGADRQRSTAQLEFGELMNLKPSRPRRG